MKRITIALVLAVLAASACASIDENAAGGQSGTKQRRLEFPPIPMG